MIRDELAKLKAGPRDLRKFGLVVGGVFALPALVLWLRHKAAWPWLLVPAVPLVGLGLAWPRGLKYIYLGWMFPSNDYIIPISGILSFCLPLSTLGKDSCKGFR